MTTADRAGGLRILIVEDEALIAEELRVRLTRLGFDTVGITDTSEKAIEAADRMRPDLVLMDIRLKGPKDGIETAAHLRQHLHIPVVYLTAHSDQATLKRAKETAPFGYVLKPFQERELLIAIEMAISMHALEEQLRQRTEELELTVARLQQALGEIKVLHGLLPLCAWCRKIRNDAGAWQGLETYLSEQTDTQVTHSICPDCLAVEEAKLKGEKAQ